MAVAYQSVQTASFALSTTTVVTKPVSLAVGDLMIASIQYESTASLTPPLGWASVLSVTTPAITQKTTIYYKFADSSDVAASNFTFTASISGLMFGAIMRFTGASIPQPVFSSNSATVAGTFTATSITSINTLANSLFVIGTATNGANTTNGYAMTTSNPSWTEIWDTNGSGASSAAAVSASRPASTATGTCGAVTSGGQSAGYIISIPPDKSISQTDTIITSEVVTNNLAFTKLDTVTTSDDIESVKARLWTEESKNSAIWTEEDR